MMPWLFRLLMVLFVVGSLALGWRSGAVVAADVSLARQPTTIDRPRPGGALSGPALAARISTDLASLNAARDERAHGRSGGVVVLRSVDFERSAGAVVARGVVLDLAAPRTLHAVVDGYDGLRSYVASASSPVSTSVDPTPFSVSMTDRDVLSSFSVRFLDAAMSEIPMRTPDSPARSVAPLLSDDLLRAADLGEIAARLAALGYVDDRPGIANDDVLLAAVVRLRRDRAIPGPDLVSVGDLLALRALTSGAFPTADLSSY